VNSVGSLLHADAHPPDNEREGWVMSHKLAFDGAAALASAMA
jgi:hypothetical protein